MNGWTLLLILVSLFSFVGGQLLFKQAASDEPAADGSRPKTRRAAIFAAGIVCMTISFFVNLGLLQHLDLSFLFPFQGLSVLIVALGACVFLRERLTPSLVLGTLLITAGVMLVSTS
jgi:undecaprenyl phosphate-alpha-L-ara4N flippase subunit ArnE